MRPTSAGAKLKYKVGTVIRRAMAVGATVSVLLIAGSQVASAATSRPSAVAGAKFERAVGVMPLDRDTYDDITPMLKSSAQAV